MTLQYDTLARSEAVLFLGLELAAITAADLLVCLFTGGLIPSPNNVLADFTAVEPVGTWYTRAVATVGQVYELPDGSLAFSFDSVEFDYAGVSPAEIITGYFVVTAVVPRLVSSRRLDTPVSMGNVLDSCIVQPGLRLPPILAS